MATAQFRMKAGDDKILRLSILDDDGEPLNLTGASAILWEMARLQSGPLDAAVTKTLGSGVTIVSPPTGGVIEVALEPADTSALAGTYRHETRITDTDGAVVSVQFTDLNHYGLFEIEPQYIVQP